MRDPENYALPAFLRDRRKELRLDRADVAERMGYSNVDKGIRRVEELESGKSEHFSELGPAVAKALETTFEYLVELLRISREQASEDIDADYRKRFRPHVVWETPGESRPPRFIGSYDRWLIHYFDEHSSPSSYLEQAKAAMPKDRVVSLFGTIRSFVINYSPDDAARYDPDGQLLERLPTARRLGHTILPI